MTTTAPPREFIVALFYDPERDEYLVEHAMDETAHCRRWGFPSTERRTDVNDVPEASMDAVRRIAKERFGYEMDASDHMRCYRLMDETDPNDKCISYESFLVVVRDRKQLVSQPDITAEWKTFSALTLFAERRFFPRLHLVFLNAAEEHLQFADDGDEDEDPEEFTEL